MLELIADSFDVSSSPVTGIQTFSFLLDIVCILNEAELLSLFAQRQPFSDNHLSY